MPKETSPDGEPTPQTLERQKRLYESVDSDGYVDLGLKKEFVGRLDWSDEELRQGAAKYVKGEVGTDFPEAFEPLIDAMADVESELTAIVKPYVVDFKASPCGSRQELFESGIMALCINNEWRIYAICSPEPDAFDDLGDWKAECSIVEDAWIGLTCIRELIRLDEDPEGHCENLRRISNDSDKGWSIKKLVRPQSELSVFEVIAGNAYRLGRIIERVRVQKFRRDVLAARKMQDARSKGGQATAALTSDEWELVIAERKRLARANPQGGAKNAAKLIWNQLQGGTFPGISRPLSNIPAPGTIERKRLGR